ncbi:MAG: hypothetical protein CME36_20025 [unclassified Hahellaceae]|nr:hypothetical protein [Hahellaceae bacterium]|tara:strand:- start:74564 stop:75751 length:1188 start_codon:yes stop_codon:yes gene_type:complete
MRFKDTFVRPLVTSSISTFSLTAMALGIACTAAAVETTIKDTTLTLYGYGKLDLIYDVDADLGNLITHSNIRLDDQQGPDGHTRIQAIESRLGITTVTPVTGGSLKTVLEGDFYGSGGGVFRLRHAYGEWNGILAGQTWSNFGNFLGTTPTLDFLGQIGQPVIARQAQLRYTTGGFSVALEAPGTLGGATAVMPVGGPDPVTPDADSQKDLPDITVQFKTTVDMLSFAISGVARQISVYDDDSDNEESAFGYGVGLAAKLTLTDRLRVQSSLVYGDGIGGYLYASPGASAYYDPANESVETIEAMGGTLGVSLDVGPGSINLGYGIATADWDEAEDAGLAVAGSDETRQSFFLNYSWSTVSNVLYGLEAGHHSRETVGGGEGDAIRLQAMAKYSF